MSNPLAAGIHALAVPGLADGFAAVLGAHRFLHNDAVTLPSLIQPLHEVSRQWRRQAPQTWGLIIHDWSLLSYPGHRRKADQAKVNHGRGYELATLLLVEGNDGQPIAPLEFRLRAAKAVSLMQLAGHLVPRRCQEVSYQGQQAVQHVAEAEVVLDRPAWRHRGRGKKKTNERVPKAPITLRLVVSRVCDSSARTLAVWYLLTNVPAEVETATVALWYYWRWRIETFHKLIKSAGHQMEQWQQLGGEAIAKRLVVAAMACTLVWRLERQSSPEAGSLRALLVQLSGRQMNRGKECTTPALLAGLWALLAMMEALEQHSVEELRQFKQMVLGTAEEDTG